MTVILHQQIPLTQWKLPDTHINFPKHKEKEERTRKRTINDDRILCKIDSHDDPLTLPQVNHRMLSMAELLIKMIIHTTALKLARNW